MIVVTNGTTYLTVDAFLDRFEQMGEGRQFSYATGDLANACAHDEDARALRNKVQNLEKIGRIALTQRRRPDIKLKGGGAAFEYLATRRKPKGEG